MTDWAVVARTWCAKNPPPPGAAMGSRTPTSDAEDAAWRDWSMRFQQAGLGTLHWPPEHGGQGLSRAESYSVERELAAAGMPLPLQDIGNNLVGPALIKHGTDHQREAVLPGILQQGTIWTQLFSEPEAGSDLASLRTTAERSPTGWTIRGQKVWSTYAHIADMGFLLARTGTPADRHRGLGVFLLPMSSPGVSVRPIREITGDCDFNEVFFDDVHLPSGAILGGSGDGWGIAMGLLADERRLADRWVIAVQSEVSRLNTVIAGLVQPAQAVAEARLGELAAQIESVAALLRAPTPEPGDELIAKVAWTELSMDIHRLALDLIADAPGIPEGWAQRWSDNYLYTRAHSISGGANEVMRNVIAKRILGLPTA